MNRSAFLAITLLAACVEPMELPDPEPPSREGEIGTAELVSSEGTRTVTYVVTGGRPIVDGDVVLPDEVLHPELFAAPAAGRARWTDGILPYEIASDLPEFNRKGITDAISYFHRETALRFRPRVATDQSYLRFVYIGNQGFCRTHVGRENGSHEVELADGCDRGPIIHELTHALGMWHEQSRPDRDQTVTVHFENMDPDPAKRRQYDKHELDGNFIAGPYDTNSTMHYSPFTYSINGLPTMTRLDGQPIQPMANGLSDGDMRGLESMYPARAGEAPAMCRTAPQRGRFRLTADVAEVWEDVGPLTSIATHRSVSTRFNAPAAWANRAGGWNVRTRWAAGDFDGDGDQDLVGVWKDGTLNTLSMWRSDGATFTPQQPPWRQKDGTWLDSTQWLPGDFDRDGRTDLISVWKSGSSTKFAFWRSTGAAFAAPVQWIGGEGGWNDQTKWNVADFNGDGRDDILAAWPEGTATTFTVRFSSGSGLVTRHWLQRYGGWASNMQFLVGDFDGAQGADVMVAWQDSGRSTLTFYGNTGTSNGYDGGAFSPGLNWATRDGGWANNVRWSAGDYNADGRDDVLSMWNEAGRTTLVVRRSTGLINPRLAIEPWGTRRAGWQDTTSWCTGVFDLQ